MLGHRGQQPADPEEACGSRWAGGQALQLAGTLAHRAGCVLLSGPSTPLARQLCVSHSFPPHLHPAPAAGFLTTLEDWLAAAKQAQQHTLLREALVALESLPLEAPLLRSSGSASLLRAVRKLQKHPHAAVAAAAAALSDRWQAVLQGSPAGPPAAGGGAAGQQGAARMQQEQPQQGAAPAAKQQQQQQQQQPQAVKHEPAAQPQPSGQPSSQLTQRSIKDKPLFRKVVQSFNAIKTATSGPAASCRSGAAPGGSAAAGSAAKPSATAASAAAAAAAARGEAIAESSKAAGREAPAPPTAARSAAPAGGAHQAGEQAGQVHRDVDWRGQPAAGAKRSRWEPEPAAAGGTPVEQPSHKRQQQQRQQQQQQQAWRPLPAFDLPEAETPVAYGEDSTEAAAMVAARRQGAAPAAAPSSPPRPREELVAPAAMPYVPIDPEEAQEQDQQLRAAGWRPA